MRTLLVLGAVLALMVIPGCGDSQDLEAQDVQEKLGETWDAVKTYAAKKRKEAGAFFAKSMERSKALYEAAKQKAAAGTEDAKTALDAKWKDVQQAYDRMKDASAEKWGQARDAFVAAYEAFVNELGSDKDS